MIFLNPLIPFSAASSLRLMLISSGDSDKDSIVILRSLFLSSFLPYTESEPYELLRSLSRLFFLSSLSSPSLSCFDIFLSFSLELSLSDLCLDFSLSFRFFLSSPSLSFPSFSLSSDWRFFGLGGF